MENINLLKETYWCFNCNKEITPKFSERDPTCNLCGSTFVEEIEPDENKSDNPKNFIPHKNTTNTGTNNSRNRRPSQSNTQTTPPNNRVFFMQLSRNSNGQMRVVSNQSSNNAQEWAQQFNNLFNVNRFMNSNPFNMTNGYFNNLSTLPNDQNLENLLNYLMMNDPSRYGNPPTSKKAVEELPRIKLTNENIKEFQNLNCPLCMEDCVLEELVIKLKCSHSYHEKCILSWLKVNNTCPICRDELLTDDPDYENRKNERRELLRSYPSRNNTGNSSINDSNVSHPNRHSQG